MGSYDKKKYPGDIELPLGDGLEKNETILFLKTRWEEEEIEKFAIRVVDYFYKENKPWKIMGYWLKPWWKGVWIEKIATMDESWKEIIAKLEEEGLAKIELTHQFGKGQSLQELIIFSAEFFEKTLKTPTGESSLDVMAMMRVKFE